MIPADGAPFRTEIGRKAIDLPVQGGVGAPADQRLRRAPGAPENEGATPADLAESLLLDVDFKRGPGICALEVGFETLQRQQIRKQFRWAARSSRMLIIGNVPPFYHHVLSQCAEHQPDAEGDCISAALTAKHAGFDECGGSSFHIIRSMGMPAGQPRDRARSRHREPLAHRGRFPTSRVRRCRTCTI